MKYLVLFFSLAICACSSTGTKGTKYSLDEIMKLTPDRDTKETVLLMLGPPDKVFEFPEEQETAWIYFDKRSGFQKMSVGIDEKGKLQSVTWLVDDKEPENNLESALKRFPKAKFIVEDAPWENPHAAPDERFYRDPNLGVSITLRKTRQEVWSISWSNPNLLDTSKKVRKPAVKYEI